MGTLAKRSTSDEGGNCLWVTLPVHIISREKSRYPERERGDRAAAEESKDGGGSYDFAKNLPDPCGQVHYPIFPAQIRHVLLAYESTRGKRVGERPLCNPCVRQGRGRIGNSSEWINKVRSNRVVGRVCLCYVLLYISHRRGAERQGEAYTSFVYLVRLRADEC